MFLPSIREGAGWGDRGACLEYAERNSFNDMEVLALYENNGLRMGRKMIKS